MDEDGGEVFMSTIAGLFYHYEDELDMQLAAKKPELRDKEHEETARMTGKMVEDKRIVVGCPTCKLLYGVPEDTRSKSFSARACPGCMMSVFIGVQPYDVVPAFGTVAASTRRRRAQRWAVGRPV